MEVTVMSEADEMRLDCISEALMVALFYGSCFTAPWSGAKLVPEHRELQPAVVTLEVCVRGREEGVGLLCSLMVEKSQI